MAWAVPWTVLGVHRSLHHGDWIWVELGSRVLTRHLAPKDGGASLHLYANLPVVQVGPPALIVAAPFQWMQPRAGQILAAALMAVAVLAGLWLAERAGGELGAACIPRRALLAGLAVVPFWTFEVFTWGHVDDVLALLAVLGTVVLVHTGRRELLAGLLLGTGAAAKPWAVLAFPLLLGFERQKVARAALASLLTAVGWWLPFLVADRGTIGALGTLHLRLSDESTWHLFGMSGSTPGWIRAAQMLGGFALSVWVVRRAGPIAVPVVAFAWRVTSDPYMWPYYVMGPLLGAALWDVTRPARGRWAWLPWTTAAAALAEGVMPLIWTGGTPGVRIAWFAAVLVAVVGLPGASALRSAPRIEARWTGGERTVQSGST